MTRKGVAPEETALETTTTLVNIILGFSLLFPILYGVGLLVGIILGPEPSQDSQEQR